MRELQEFWLRQKFLQKCWGSAYRWLTSILRAIGSVLSEEGGFELRGVVKLLVLSWGNWRTCLPASVSNRGYSLQLVASCTFSRRVTRHASAGSELDLLVCDA